MCNNVVVIIPIYKERPNAEEQASIRQCFKILGEHPIIIISYKDLDLTIYEAIIGRKVTSKFFDKKYFNSVNSYSLLLKSLQATQDAPYVL